MTRYIGNSGRFYRVNDAESTTQNAAETEILGGTGGLFGVHGGGLNLPFGLEFADIALLLLFLFLYLESGDWEFLIIVAFLAVSAFGKNG
ncbi:MAG: hypothetical protein LBN00_01110 [Oscillospiraceae bacterium]|jgi:hypothetical protein|nr:hypothetical protein [Oscillospiraceae bacterium]